MRYAEREDLPGVTLLLRACLMLTAQIKHELVEDSRRAALIAYRGPDLPRERSRAVESKRAIPLDIRLRRPERALRRVEALLRLRLELLSETHGRTFDALSGPYTRLAKALPGDHDIELIFRPSPDPDYEIWFKVLDDLQEFASQRYGSGIGAYFERMPRLMAIEYPWHYERDTFMHAVIAHEIGHIALFNQRIGNQVWLDAAQGHLTLSEASAYRRWFVEFACDLLACRMVGPAYAVALIEHTVGQNIWFSPYTGTTHPPMPTRVAKLSQEVGRYFAGGLPARASHRDALLLCRGVTEKWMSLLPDDDGIPDHVESVIDDALDRLSDASPLGDAEYPVAVFREQLGPIWDALTTGTAPAEIVILRDRPRTNDDDPDAWSEPCDWRSILNGGYFRWLAEDQGLTLPDLLRRGSAITSERMNRCEHIQGAIELSELHRAMQGQRHQLAALEMQSPRD